MPLTEAPHESVPRVESARGDIVPAIINEALRFPGEPLDPETKDFFEPRFGHDFSRVRVHNDAKAAEAAQAMGARAFTVGREILFGCREYLPRVTGDFLVAHELTHLLQNEAADCSHNCQYYIDTSNRNSNEEEADRVAHHVMTSASPTVPDGYVVPKVRGKHTGCSPQMKEKPAIVRQHESWWGNLKEEELAASLLERAREHDFAAVKDAIDSLASTDRDDVSCAFMEQATDDDVAAFLKLPQGRLLLDRLYDELTSGSVFGDEAAQARRILTAKSKTIDPAVFSKGMQNAKIFPFRLPGHTVIVDAPIEAKRIGDGRIWVHQPVRVQRFEKFRQETSTLPAKLFADHIELPENEIVGVKLYDLGGVLQYWPALYLVQLSNETTATIGQKVIEAAGIALSLGVGTFAGAGVEAASATWGSQALIWGDRFATAIGVLGTLVQEHRGWIIQQLPDGGPEIVDYFEKLNALIAIYGLGKGSVGAAKIFVEGVAKTLPKVTASFQSIRNRLSGKKIAAFDNLRSELEKIIEDFRNIQQSTEAVFEPQLAGATGTEEFKGSLSAMMSEGGKAPPKPARAWPTKVEDLRPPKAAQAPPTRTVTASSEGVVEHPAPMPAVECIPPQLGRKPEAPEVAAGHGRVPAMGEERVPIPEDVEKRGADIVDLFEEGKSWASESAIEEDIGELLAKVDRPSGLGGKKMPERFDIGIFSHDYAEELVSSHKLPRGLDPEFRIPGSSRRIDRVDWRGRKLYEVKPKNTEQIEKGERQLNLYLQYMNREFPPHTWTGKVVTYNLRDVKSFLKKGWP
jgi:hypothetical protein